MWLPEVEPQIVRAVRMVTVVAIVSSTLGALLMFYLGAEETLTAFTLQWEPAEGDLPKNDATVIHLIEALDRFLMGIVLLYFAYGIYTLFLRPDRSQGEMGVPSWLQVSGIGELKQTLAEVIIVVLFVLFLRVAAETFVASAAPVSWAAIAQFLSLPLAIFLLAAALKLAELHPKALGRDRRR